MKRCLLFAFACLALLSPSSAAQKSKKLRPVDAENRLEAVERGCEILLERQESLAKGEKRKRTSGPEWPYEGVYRVGRKIPIGYRIGGTS
ncbi:MAG: hypothetical protein AAF368_05205, partial [Planctomycetota bacterium]